jgi:uncharacterized membrane protein
MTTSTLLSIAVAFGVFIVLDLVWFSLAGGFFKGEIGSIARLAPDGSWDVRIGVAALAYFLMAIGLVVFVLPRATSLGAALGFGALFGFVSFGIYDLTNLATLSAWTWRFVLVDMSWGTSVNAAVAAITWWVGRPSFS